MVLCAAYCIATGLRCDKLGTDVQLYSDWATMW